MVDKFFSAADFTLVDASSPRTVIYAFFEDQCVGRICPRHSLAVSGTVERILNKVLPGRQRDTGGFIDWISVFGLPETFSISLYAGEMGLFSISSNVYQGTDLSACTYLGEISTLVDVARNTEQPHFPCV